MNLADKIKLRTEQIIINIQDTIKEKGYDFGVNRMGEGSVVSALGCIGGMALSIAGVEGALATAATAVITGGGAVMIGGILTMGAVSAYKNTSRTSVEVWGPDKLTCVDKNGQSVKLNSVDVYKDIELGTFQQKYNSIVVENNVLDTQNIDLKKAVSFVLDKHYEVHPSFSIYEEPSLKHKKSENVETALRAAFRDKTVDYPKLAEISNKIHELREKGTAKKLNVSTPKIS